MQSRCNRGGGGGGGESRGNRQGPVPEGPAMHSAWWDGTSGDGVCTIFEMFQELKSEIASPFFPGAEVLGDKVDGLTSEGPRKRKKYRDAASNDQVNPYKNTTNVR